MTQVFYCSTFFGAMTLTAAIDAGLFQRDGERRVLLVSTNSTVPEVITPVDRAPGYETLCDRFDEVVSWNDFVAPMHPSSWVPRAVDVPILQRVVRTHLGFGDVSRLVVESIAVAPARSIASLVRDCPITVFSDGLMSYGPTRDAIPDDISGRIDQLLYLDLVVGLEPLLLQEYGVHAVAIPDAAFVRVLSHLPSPRGARESRGHPVILGQYLSAIGIMTAQEESSLHVGMLAALAARGHRHVVFKPHPAAGTGHVRALRWAAADLGLHLTLVEDSVSAEAWMRDAQPDLVVSCFSTALFTASRYLGLATATMGCDGTLDRITPYQNSNRIPATVVDALVPQLQPGGNTIHPPRTDISELVRAVGFCMQPYRHPELRAAASDYLAVHGTGRYFKRRRLQATGLVPLPIYRSRHARRVLHAARRVAVLRRAERHIRRLTAQALTGG